MSTLRNKARPRQTAAVPLGQDGRHPAPRGQIKTTKESQMSTKNHWTKRLIAEAAACQTRMPWERGAPRKAMIARRKANEAEARPQKSA